MIESNFKKDLERNIDLYVNGRLSAEQIDDLWVELIQDEYYLDYTKSVANIKSIIEKQRTTTKNAPVYKLRKYASYGVAAAIAIIIGVIGVMNYSVDNGLVSQQGPIEFIDLNQVRGANDAPSVTDNEIIRKAIELANDGNVEDAIRLLETELLKVESFELVAEISLTLGSIQYNYGDYLASIENFKNVVEREEIDILTLEKGYWYLGNAYFQLDQLTEAQESFQKAYDLNGQYSRIAKSYLEALNMR